MARFISILSLIACGALLVACSKQEEAPAAAAAPAAPEPDPSAASVRVAALEEEIPSIQFKLPGLTEQSPAAPDPLKPASAGGESRGLTDLTTLRPGTTMEAGDAAVQPAEMLAFFPPFYPLSMRMEGTEGRIDLRLAIGETGAVTRVDVLAATAPQFREHAVAAAKDWRFLPAKVDGKPVPIIVTFPVPFVSEFGSGELPANSPLARLTYIDGTFYSTGPDGRFAPANVEVTPLLRPTPFFSRPESETKQLRVVLNFSVSEQGQVLNPEVVESSNSAFDQAALTAVKYWQFVPQIRNGKARQASVKLPIVFGAAGPNG